MTLTLQEIRADFDWRYAFEYAGHNAQADDEDFDHLGDDCRPIPHGEPNLLLVGSSAVPDTPFTLDDVSEVRHAIAGENDGDPWICVGQLKDGRWFALEAGCDYTGWD